MIFMDIKQTQIDEFEVPDPSRIKKGINMIKKFLNKDKRCLDIGLAGNGFGDTISKEYNSEVYGIDIHKRSIKNIKTMVHDVNQGIPFKDNYFDVLTAGELIEHVYNDEFFLQECNRVLNKDGILLITTPNLNYLYNRILILFGKMPIFVYASYHYNIYNKKELIKKLEKNGFEILEVKSSHVLFSSRRNKLGVIFEKIGEYLPSFGAHLIISAKKK